MDESGPAFCWAALFVGTRSEIRGGERSEVGQGLTRGREVAVLRGRRERHWRGLCGLWWCVEWPGGLALRQELEGGMSSGVRDALRAGWCGGLVGVCAACLHPALGSRKLACRSLHLCKQKCLESGRGRFAGASHANHPSQL